MVCLISACSDEPETMVQPCGLDMLDQTPTATNISFRDQVLPVFANSCSLVRYCHNEPQGSQGDLYLGPNSADPLYPPDVTTVTAVYAALVNAPSVRANVLVRIKAYAPEESFLMHKINASQNCSSIVCTDPIKGTTDTQSCGDKMPPNNAVPLDTAKADILYAWILEGESTIRLETGGLG